METRIMELVLNCLSSRLLATGQRETFKLTCSPGLLIRIIPDRALRIKLRVKCICLSYLHCYPRRVTKMLKEIFILVERSREDVKATVFNCVKL